MNPFELCYGCMEIKGSQKKCANCGYQEDSGPESSHHLPPGTILMSKYLVGKVLGQGGFGITYVAYDLTLELKLAVKEFFPMGLVARARGNIEVDTYAGEQKAQYSFGLDRFLYEAKTLARFSEHPNIVTVRDFFPANGTAYTVMNYIEGKTLEDYLKDAGGKIPFPKMIEIMMPVMDALREVHQCGFMHRDISPDNIFIRNDGRVILIDFGAARQDLQSKSRSLSVILKAGYSPEEQYRSRGEQGPWSDIYAVAATIYRGIVGDVPPESMDRLAEDTLIAPSQLGTIIGVNQEQALLKALAVRAEERYQTVAEMQEALTNTMAEHAVEQVNPEGAKVQESIEGQPEQKFSDRPVIEISPKINSPQIKEDESKQVIRVKHGLNAKVKVAIITSCLIILASVVILVDAAVAREKTIVYDGGTYTGEVRFWKPDGQGTLISKGGTKYSGGYKDGLKHGWGTYIWLNGDYYVGDFVDDMMHGSGRLNYSNGDKYVGEFINNIRHGSGRLIYSNGDYYDGAWENDKFNGQGTYVYSNGDKYVGSFNNGNWHGHGTLIWLNIYKYTGEWEDGVRKGKINDYNSLLSSQTPIVTSTEQGSVTLMKEGHSYKGEYIDGTINGHGTYIWPNGDKYVGEFNNAMYHGYGTYTYSDGRELNGKWYKNDYMGN